MHFFRALTVIGQTDIVKNDLPGGNRPAAGINTEYLKEESCRVGRKIKTS